MKRISVFSVTIMGLISLLFLANCKSDKNKEPIIVQGRIVDSCVNGKPVANVTVQLRDTHKPGLLGGCKDNVDLAAKTDSNGNFYFQFNDVCFNDALQLTASKGSSGFIEVVGIDVNTGANLGDIVLKNNLVYLLGVDTDSAFGPNDTLFYNIRQTGQFPLDSLYEIKTGPFTAGFFDTLVTTIPYDLSTHKGWQNIRHRWLLKNGNKVYTHQDTTFKTERPCTNTTRIRLKITK